jgi:two-component system, LytTR family, response regulator
VDPAELVASIQKARRYSNLESLQQQISELLRTNGKKTFDRIALRTSKGLFFVQANEIACLESCGNYSFVHLSSGERHLDARNLKSYEEILQNPDFVRVHQSFIVNIALVDKVLKGPNGSVLLCGDLEIPVSRRRKDALKGILPLYD